MNTLDMNTVDNKRRSSPQLDNKRNLRDFEAFLVQKYKSRYDRLSLIYQFASVLSGRSAVMGDTDNMTDKMFGEAEMLIAFQAEADGSVDTRKIGGLVN